MTLVGGVGTLLGPLVGAIVVATMQRELAFLGGWVVVIQGAIFILFVLFLRKGVVGALEDWLARRAVRRRDAEFTAARSAADAKSGT